MIYLNVPYSEKEKAKSLGAKWNPEHKKWYVPSKIINEYMNFSEWLDGSLIISSNIYIVEANRTCWKCKKETNVIAFGIKDYIDLEELENLGNSDLNPFEEPIFMIVMLETIPNKVLEYIKSNFNFKLKYSHTVGEKYLANCCIHCDSLQGEFHLFSESFDSPFYVQTKEDAKKLTLYEISLPFDFSTDITASLPIMIGYSVEEDMQETLIKKYSTHKKLDIII